MAITNNVTNYPGNYTLNASYRLTLRSAVDDIYLKALNGFVLIDTPLTNTTGNLLVDQDAEVTQNLTVKEDSFLEGNVQLGTEGAENEIDNFGLFTENLLPFEDQNIDIGDETHRWGTLYVTDGYIYSEANVQNPYGREYSLGDVYDTTEHRKFDTDGSAAALYVAGGVGIEKDLNVGGYIYGRVEFANTTTFVYFTATNSPEIHNLTFVRRENVGDDQSPVFVDIEGVEDGLTYVPEEGLLTTDRAFIAESDASTSTTTGALIVAGGVGVAGTMTIGGSVIPAEDLVSNLGSTTTNWAEGHIHDIYTRLLTSTTGTIQIDPAAGVTEIVGDIRVRGERPIGTAPMVTNTLYVTMDGDDTNDGRAQDPSRACRTIAGATNSPYFRPGTQILVSAGHYKEDNPIRLKPYTSVRGSDIRTTFIEPLNKTQDLFHLDSGCYLNYMTFLNGRSGLLEGEYTEGFNRGAYCTAFPPQAGDDRIDLYQSPYVQNCTNQSGPWLKDGTMFIPNQTVQVPAAVAIGSWPANTTTIRVETSIGTIERGMHINAGQQNPGFFDARTLMLANKPFLQEQVVAYVDRTFNTGTFIYDDVKCSRDTGLIVESIATDMMQDSISDSVFAGLQYWRQSGYVDAVGDQITTTTAAINYVKSLATATVFAAATSVEADIVAERFDNILTILNTSSGSLATGEFAQWVTDSIVSNSIASTATELVAGFNALIAAKDDIAQQTIDYINGTLTAFVYDDVKCSRDTGLIVDSLIQDLLHEGTTQSTFAGLQYWNQSGYVGAIGDELTTTTNAITYVRDLAKKVIVGDTAGTRYQSTVDQVVPALLGTSAEATIIETDFDVILDILTGGTAGVTDIIIPNGLAASTSSAVVNAYNVLQENRSYIQAEAIAYVESTKTPDFVYDQTLCYRDVGYMLDSVSFDLLYGGNKQAVQSGVYYYGFDGSSTAIVGEIPQTTAAYQYIKELIPNVIRGITISTSTLYQTAVPQVISSTIGTPIEVDNANELIDLIINIINNGPSAAPAGIPINLDMTLDEYAIAAATLLNDNRDFIRAEVVAYVDTLSTYLYNEDTCRRDVGYLVDSVAFDLLHGGNKQSIKSGVYYFGYGSITTEVPQEVPQVVAAYSFIKSLLPSIIKAERIASPYQTSVAQDDITYPAATDNEVAILNSKIDVITNIIRNGPSAVTAKIPMNLTESDADQLMYAYQQLDANKEFIKAEVIAYLNTFGTFDYSREFCFRDVGILVENVAYDAAFGGNEKSVESGQAYYDGVVSKIAGQEIQTVAAVDYLNHLIQQIIVNTTCTDLLSNGVSTTATYAQIRNTVLAGGSIASRSIGDLFNTITTIIENGTGAAPDIYKGTNVDAAYVSAEILMQANRKFIQEDTINYINNLVLDFPYSETKCRRDTGLILDSIALDLLHPTTGHSQSTFAGLQYWNQDSYIGDIEAQLSPTVEAIAYLRDLSVKIIQNITPADDLVVRYQNTFTQVTNLEPATSVQADVLITNFDNIIEIVNGNNTGWTDRIITNGDPSNQLDYINAIALLQANKDYLAHEVTAFVDATNAGFAYDSDKCRRDVGYIVDCMSFDVLHGGNKQSIQAGLYYYGFSTATIAIRNQEIQTTAAFNYLATLTSQVIKGEAVARLQNRVGQVYLADVGTDYEVFELNKAISTITNIITNGPTVAAAPSPITLTASSTASVFNAFNLIKANKEFITEEVIAYIDQTYNPNSFNYDEALCYRDVGLIVDAVSQDVLVGGNTKSIEAGLAYWNFGVSHVGGQETTTTMALNYARDIALQIVANQTVTPQTGTITTQVINPFFQYGGDYMPQQSIRRNFDIITTIINDGPQYAPPSYLGGGLFALTGISPDEVQNSPVVVSITTVTTGTYIIGLNTSTVGFGNNSTLYFGDVLTFPAQSDKVEELSLEYTGNASTWNLRKVDPIGSMGGSLVDGGVISDRSPIQSFVYDAFTQLTQGGRGVHIKRDGYAQLVSVFTIFSSVGVEVDSGGIASIVNSNANFGDLCLVAKGYGKRKFSGQIYNPAFKAYPESPDIPGSDNFDQYYPNGFWPNNAQVAVYVPDLEDRPHISLVMEIIPPEGHENEQGFPGFLNASPTTSTLTTGTITIQNVSTDGVAIGNSVYVRDQFGRTTSTVQDSLGNWIPYVATGTVVSNLGYNSITLSKALTSGGGEADNPNYFDFYFCGNAYYTVLSSEIIDNPQYNSNADLIPAGVNILSTSSTGGDISQVPAHVSALQYLNDLTTQVISNTEVTPLQSTTTQTILPLVRGGSEAESFINLRFGEIIDIVNAPNLDAAEKVIKPALRTKDGPEVQGGGAAITLIEENIEFLADEVTQYVRDNFIGSTFTYDETICRRDAGYILDGNYYDIALGSNWNAIYSGIAYRRSVSSVVVEDQLTQTIGAINYLKEQSQTSLSGSELAITRSDAAFDEIMNIIAEGESAADALILPTPGDISENDNRVKAKNLLLANKEFIQAEIIAYIADQAASATPPFDPNFVYDSTKCERDVGYILDAVGYDLMFGSNFRSITAGLAYYRGNSADVVGFQKTATLGALVELKSLIAASVASDATAVTRANSLMNIIIDIFDNGSSAAPTFSLPDPSGFDVDYSDARRLVTNNKTFIKAEIAAWIASQVATNTAPFTTSFTYDVAACKRDVGFILDALRYDVTYGGNLETIVAARAYFDGVSSVLGAGEKAPTLAAYAYLKSIVSDISQGIAVTPSAGNPYTQNTAGSPGNLSAATFLEDRIQEIYDTIDTDGVLPSEVTPDTSWVDSGLTTAYADLMTDKATIQSDIITFVDNNYQTFTYNSDKCRRDVGYIVDSLAYDVLYDTNWATIISARAYFEGAASVLPATEQAATVAAYDRMSGVIQDIVQGNTVTVSPGNTVLQNTSLSAASVTEATTLDSLIQIIEDVITAGSVSGLPAIAAPSISWADVDLQNALVQLDSDQTTMIDDMITFIDDEFVGTFGFDSAQCQRDVKVILQRLIYDIETGGRYNSVMCGLAYWNRTGTYHKVQLGENVTRTDLFPHNATVNFYQRSYMSASGYVFEYVGAGTNYGALPQRGVADPVQTKETVQLDSGKVFFTSTDQNGDFRIGPGLVISQATGVLSGRTFTKSLFANMTPFILAIEAGLG